MNINFFTGIFKGLTKGTTIQRNTFDWLLLFFSLERPHKNVNSNNRSDVMLPLSKQRDFSKGNVLQKLVSEYKQESIVTSRTSSMKCIIGVPNILV